MIPAKVFPFGVIVTLTSAGTYLSNVAVVGDIVAGRTITSPSIATLPFSNLIFVIFDMLPSPNAPPSLNTTGVVCL